ncbi:FIG00388203: hypothetical protein [hydrothermal vent metagenome]|uniref:PD-(D/E)XK endonuclease-like domain-containing protein n=1 Tax=hydrothermal vent metagenome TaxID=652676 RepID=A0A1W1C2Y0_9ZZZZ
MSTKTVVLPSTRSIRQRLLTYSNSLIANYITMGEFLQKSIFIKDLRFIDEDTRTILLLQASNFSNFKKLKIERNFYSFTKNASYIFGFLEELSGEMVPLEAIAEFDLYGEYEEHIEILRELKRRYEELCLKHGVCDRFMIPNYYQLNKSYLKRAGVIEVEASGIFTNFELSLLQKISEITPLFLRISTDSYNVKMRQRIGEAFGIELESGYNYLLDLKSRTIIEQDPTQEQSNIELYALSGGMLQVALIKKKIFEYIQKGYEASKIAVILPNENLKSSLELFDEKQNFNFAMGKSMQESFVYQKIRATLDALDEESVENEVRLERYGDDLFVALFSHYKKSVSEVDLADILESFLEYAQSNQERRILQEEIYRFKKLLDFMDSLTLKAALTIFLSRVGARALDDVGGGKITVMGVLETRGVTFDAVIIPDFNDANVPKRIQKDMFLNSALRKRVGLPTTEDREELQKHYYTSLFRNTKEVCISYVKSKSELPSRFLKELGVSCPKEIDEDALSLLLFRRGVKSQKEHQSFSVTYDFSTSKLSNSKLATFLSCKQKFYLRYIASIQNFEIPKDMPQEWEIGKRLHQALKALYRDRSHFEDRDTLCYELSKRLDEACGASELERFQISLYKKRLQKFCDEEMKRFGMGKRVYRCEEPIEREYQGLRLHGVIDRIDKSQDGKLEVLDYKSGSLKLYNANSVEDATDFQLEFYYLLASSLGDVESVAFYDLKEGRVVEEALFKQKLELLHKHLNSLRELKSFEVELCDDLKLCSNCEYKTICGRD